MKACLWLAWNSYWRLPPFQKCILQEFCQGQISKGGDTDRYVARNFAVGFPIPRIQLNAPSVADPRQTYLSPVTTILLCLFCPQDNRSSCQHNLWTLWLQLTQSESSSGDRLWRYLRWTTNPIAASFRWIYLDFKRPAVEILPQFSFQSILCYDGNSRTEVISWTGFTCQKEGQRWEGKARQFAGRSETLWICTVTKLFDKVQIALTKRNN